MAKCAECGYLGLRRISDNEIVEANERVRSGEERIGAQTKYEPKPVCLLLKRSFTNAECLDGALRNALRAEYDCGEAIEWKPGHGPKEHIELKMLEEQREFHKDMKKKDRLTVLLAAGVSAIAAVVAALVGAAFTYLLMTGNG